MKIFVGDSTYNLKGGFVKRGVWILLAVIILLSGLYSVGADEVGVVLRFGKYVRTTNPGLHLKVPFGVENVAKVKVKKVFKQEFGFRTIKADVRTQYSSRSYQNESVMLTGDLNVAEVEWIV
ncbi:MAG TPA: SPFH domain-containing protein, partial [Candidatus Krumholzibacterium sp.]|nr:SPFH domain-containing protein [Candidatus Krumholzibacterium sp.]